MSGGLRVLILASELPPGPGGIGAHAHALAVALSRRGDDVMVMGSQDYVTDAERAAFAAESPVPIERWTDASDPVRTAARRTRAMRRAISRFRPDVVVASGGRVLWLAAAVCPAAGLPWVAVVHGTELAGGVVHRKLTRRALRSATRVVAVSEFTAGLAADLGCHRGIDVIPNGADGERHRPDAARRSAFRERHGIGDRPMILTVGNVTERKGQHLVVEALPKIIEAVPDVLYVAVGRPTTGESLQARAEALGVADRLILTGQVEADEVVDAHAAADVFAMTSTSTASGDVEGYGIAVVEAAFSGVPAVVTAGTGAEEAVVHDVTGLAVAGRTGPIAGALVDLLTDPERRAAMGVEAGRRARSGATWGHRSEHYGRVLAEAVQGSRPRIVVTSHTEHWRDSNGRIVGFGATTREIDHLATLASELVHVAPLHSGVPPALALAPSASNVRVSAVQPAGGAGLRAKVGAVLAIPRWARTIWRELDGADVAHVRCPAGISMVALAVLAVRRRPRHRWIKYAGDWDPTGPDPRTYAAQRWWLGRGFARGVVTVNGRWERQPEWVRTFDNPTLTDAELARGRAAAGAKASVSPLRVVFAGRLNESKGADRAVAHVLELRARGADVVIDLVGEGPLRGRIEQLSEQAPGAVVCHGWLARTDLEGVLAEGHVFLLPSRAEGFPKVVAEAMAFGCVPVTSGVGGLAQTLGETGGAVVVGDGDSWVDALGSLLDGDLRRRLVGEGLAAAERFSYRSYLEAVRAMAAEAWNRKI